MAFARIYSAQTELLHGRIVTVEIDTARGLNHFTIVGLGDRSVEEARDRVGSALKNSGFNSPKTKNQKTVVSLSPADLKKEGSHFDLPIALGYLLAEGLETTPIDRSLFIGELALDGTVGPVRGVLAITLQAFSEGFREIYVPLGNADEASLVQGIKVFGVSNLKEVVSHITQASHTKLSVHTSQTIVLQENKNAVHFGMIRGQEHVKRGLLIAAAGGHNVLLYGPPGSGKTTLAKALSSIVPELNREHAIEVTAIHSILNTTTNLQTVPPFRAPHHTASYTAVIGGGTSPRPGEITLAHRGILFLDEFPEFDRRVIEALRQPLEEHRICITRAKSTAYFPSDFILIAAMNPCPCGYKGSKVKPCTCTAADTLRYKKKLSGPLLDRIDITIYVGEVPYDKIHQVEDTDESNRLREQVVQARARAYARAQPLTPLSPETARLFQEHAHTLGLSARAYKRTHRLARTIADLEGSLDITTNHILEALSYRSRFETN